MLKSLRATNFKKHKDLAVDFTTGLNVITGPNWQGKSSILHAVLYSFFGVSAVPGGAKLVQNRDATKHKVTLEWISGEHVYTVSRTGSTSNLWKDGEDDEHLIATSTSSVNDKIEELLGMTRKDFVRIMYARQKKADQILSYGATELHQIISDVTKLEQVNMVVDKCAAKRAAAEYKLQAFPVLDIETATNSITQLTPVIKEKAESLEETKVLLQKAETDLAAAAEELRQLREDNATNKEKVARRNELLQEISELNEKVIAAKEDIQNRPATGTNSELLAEQKKALTATIAEMRKTQELWKDYDKSVSTAEQQKLSGFTNLHLAQKAYNEFDKKGLDVPAPDLDALKLAISEQRVVVLAGKAEVSRLTAAVEQSFCPTCKREHEGASKAALEADLVNAVSTQATEVTKLDAAEGTLTSAQKLHARFEQSNAVAASLEAAQGLFKQACDNLEDFLGDPPKEVRVTDADLESEAQKYNAIIEQEKQAALEEQAVANLKDRLKDYELSRDTKLAQVKEIPEALEVRSTDDLVAKNAELSQKKNTHNEAVTLLTNECSHLALQLNAHQQTLIDAAEIAEETKQLGRTIQLCKNLEKFLRTNKDSFVQEVWDNITAYASFVADTCTSGEISRLARTPEGDFEYYENGNIFPIDAASGAQSAILGLGVQLALAEVLPCQLGALMLDEPTADMSPEVALSLSTLLSQNGNQVVLISHRELDGLAAENSVCL